MVRAASSSESKPETQLSLLCAGLIESTWLAAVCVVPLLFHPQSSFSGYQPFKFGFVRMLAVIGGVAWLLRTLELRPDVGATLRNFSRSSLSILFLLFGLTIVLATAFSIERHMSIWGAPETLQGAVSYAAQLVLCALVASHMRTRAQIERFITVLLVTSFAVGIFTILQRFGFDPRYPKLPNDRAFGPVGHPIYLAGYLLMSIPLAIYRLLLARETRGPQKFRTMFLWLYGGILVVQLAAFFCAESRGPILALGTMLFSLAILFAAYHGSKRTIIVSGTIVAAAILLIFAGVDFKTLGQIPGFERFAGTSSLQNGVDYFRAEIWKQAPTIIFADEPLPHPTNGQDRHHHLRPWIGYGPETLACVLPRYYEVDDPETHIIESRFHNLVWDLWFSLGAAGLTTYLVGLAVLFYCACARLGFTNAKANRAVFAATIFLATAGVTLAVVLFFGRGFLGVGILTGLVAGFLIYAGIAAFSSARTRKPQSIVDLLILTLIAAIAGHAIDMAFAFPTAATGVLFWLYVGLLFALLRTNDAEMAKLPATKSKTHPLDRTWLSSGIVGLGICALLISTIHKYGFEPFSMLDVIASSLCDLSGIDGRNSLLLIPLLAFCGTAAFALALDDTMASGAKPVFGRTVAIAGGLGFVLLLWRARQIADIGIIPSSAATEARALDQASGYQMLFLSGSIVLLALLFLVGFMLVRGEKFSTHPRSSLSGAIPAMAFLGVIVLLWEVAFAQLNAAVTVGWAGALFEIGQPRLASAVYRRAVAQDPKTFLYRALLSETLVQQSRVDADPANLEKIFAEAERALLEARKVSDLNRSSFYLARLYLLWADRVTEPRKRELVAKAREAMSCAETFEPHNEPVKKLKEAASGMMKP
jgi:O-antigen ligase